MKKTVSAGKGVYKAGKLTAQGTVIAGKGTVIAGKYDGASGTLKKRDRKAGLMGELLADTGARAYAKRRSTAVQERQRGPGLSTLKAKRKALARRKKGR